MNKGKSQIILLLLLFSIVACSNKPDVNVADVLVKSEKQLRTLNTVKTTASAYDGKKDIKFRLMVEGHPTKEEATKLFNKILDTVTENSGDKNIWDYYNAKLDIKNYSDGVIYQATENAGESLNIKRNDS